MTNAPHTEERERIGRLIDPDEWAAFDRGLITTRGRLISPTDGLRERHCKRSLAKADAIIAGRPSLPAEVGEIVREYRPSMDGDVLHLWAQDACATIAPLSADLEAARGIIRRLVATDDAHETLHAEDGDDVARMIEYAEAFKAARALLNPQPPESPSNA